MTATLALLLAAGTGGAYAIGEIGSRDIKDDSVRSKDLRDGRGVRGKDVRRNAIGGHQVDEKSLIGSDIVAMQGSQTGACALTDGVFVDCAAADIDLDRRSTLMIVASGGFSGEAMNGSSARCEVRVDGAAQPLAENPGELVDNSDGLATDGFARTSVVESIAAGDHSVALACSQLGTDAATIRAPTIAVIAVTTRG